MENVWDHFGNWAAVFIWIAMYSIFLLFIPFYRKSQKKPSSVYLAFIVAFALEMFGIPMTMYIVAWAFGQNLPEGILWGHTLINQIGLTGTYIAIATTLVGGLLIILGWKEIYKKYWSKEDGTGELVTTGIYRYIRHPQYTGFLLITLGLIFEWATLPLIIMWPILLTIYYKLARKEEHDMEREFGGRYLTYKSRTSMFLPLKIFSSKNYTYSA
ncbi:MAG: isoprenylcysteine carboxylmethyltransferase family protein [Thermotogaceae bacterium]|nr:isoprenylcysteine carboxylmethyltransferase family protein [Thermotogaceae bacterium]